MKCNLPSSDTIDLPMILHNQFPPTVLVNDEAGIVGPGCGCNDNLLPSTLLLMVGVYKPSFL